MSVATARLVSAAFEPTTKGACAAEPSLSAKMGDSSRTQPSTAGAKPPALMTTAFPVGGSAWSTCSAVTARRHPASVALPQPAFCARLMPSGSCLASGCA